LRATGAAHRHGIVVAGIAIPRRESVPAIGAIRRGKTHVCLHRLVGPVRGTEDGAVYGGAGVVGLPKYAAGAALNDRE
jgi:hypothetical protein